MLIVAQAQLAHRASLSLLGAGIALMGIADSGFAYFSAAGTYYSSMMDLGWVAGFGALALAALCATGVDPDEDLVPVPTRTRVWLPYLPVLLAGVIGMRRLLPGMHSGPIPVVALMLVVILLARQLLVLAENRRLVLALTTQAFRDPLTGLANRALFLNRLTHAAQRRRRQLIPLALLVLDLDGFKQVNDTLGHAAGDDLLIRVGERLTGVLRATDTIARLGGDEFAVLIEDDATTAQLLADRIADAFTTPFILDGHPLHRACQHRPHGRVRRRHDTDTSPDELLKQADLAMYAAKRAGGGIHTASTPNHPTEQQPQPARRDPLLAPWPGASVPLPE